MIKSKNLLGNKVLLLLAFVLFAIGFSVINNAFLVFGQTSYPQWRGTSNIKAPYLAENLDYLKQESDSLKNGTWHTVIESCMGRGDNNINTITRTNDKNKTIFVSVSTAAQDPGYNWCNLEFYINGEQVVWQNMTNDNYYNRVCSAVVPVPPGATYRIEAGVLVTSLWGTNYGFICLLKEFY